MAGAGFGEHLKREREMRGVSLEEIASATRIGIRFLEALENESWHTLPGGVFNRGFVRTIARFLGLEEEALLAEYSLATGENRPPQATSPVPHVAPQPAASTSVSWKLLIAVPLALFLTAGSWYIWQRVSARRVELEAAITSLPTPPAPPAIPATLLAPPDPVGAAPLSSEASTLPASSWPEVNQDLLLKVEAVRDTEVTVTSDGQIIFAGGISAGQSRSMSARTSLTVEVQDAGAVRIELNGAPVGPIGPSGRPGKITLGHPSAPADSGGHD